MDRNYDLDWLKKACRVWANQNNALGQQISKLINERACLIEEYRRGTLGEKQKHISEIDEQINSLLKQMETIELPMEEICEDSGV